MRSSIFAGMPRVLIAGGGIGGLTAALALLRVGIDVEVYEQAQELKEVGAGVHSGTRQSLLGADRPEFTGTIAWRGIVPMERLPAHMARMVGSNWVGPGGHVVHYPLRAGKVMNFVGILERSDWQIESWTARGTPDELIADFRGWHDDIQAFIREMHTPYKWALMVRPPLERWTMKRVTLAGDAAHSMLPFLAQGAVMAIEDGCVLARCLAKYDVPKALAHY